MSQWVLGLTGGIGSGKTAASDYFASLGINVVDADVEARLAVAPKSPAWQAIYQRFGAQALQADGNLNRAWLRQKVFANPTERVWLEQLTHPIIRKQIEAKLAQSSTGYTVLVSPLLFESKQNELVKRVLLIDIDEALQLERASLRDNVQTGEIKKIIQAQLPRAQRRQQADDIVVNDGDLKHLHKQLDKQHKMYLKLAEKA